jgi:hypothetical protein
MVDYVCEPIMTDAPGAMHLLFGSGKGSGAALMMFILGIMGTAICLIFGYKLRKFTKINQDTIED